ncbi:beta-glucosidase [Niastella caeni]|uniref:beta-glucosidase n=1 Tax=Niastella caeni TaxID=2569763 RepID=A0A4S8I0L1_9BACT|nr:glycoside hydrolase family 3 N-terminal domain-containing protein [Niastella caeni]THU39192.1 beta-glucosidase [Niastella caeni]
MKFVTLVVSCLFCCHSFSYAQQPAYKDPKQPVAKRVADLLSRMTLEEKVAQLQTMHAGRPKLDDKLFNNTPKLDSLYKNGMGMINPAFDETMEVTIAARNRLQEYLRTKTRLGIPIIFIDEAHHGLVQRQVDVFPHGIGLSCSWDMNLLEKIYTHAAKQARVRGTSMVLAPVVDVCRDPRWGRTGETLGEDPYLCGMLGSAIVKGFQGSNNGVIAPDHVAATLKHFSGHGQSESGTNQAPANYSVRVIREAHMEPFRLCVKYANPAGIMASYNEIDGMPSHANKWLLKDVLRKEWSYNGIVVSDWFGIDQLWNKHYIAVDQKAAALKAFNAGVTTDLPYGVNYRHLGALVKENKISTKELDSAVAKILELKFRLGLFEQTQPIDLELAKQNAANTEGRQLALKIAEESMVLLKNAPFGTATGNLLPLKKDQYKKIAIVGPMAAVNFLGDYSGLPNKNVSLLEGIKNKAQGAEVLYAKGCRITVNGDSISQNNYQYIDTIIFPSKEENAQLIDEAVKTAQQADVAVVAIGENEQLSREAWGPNHFGDMADLRLQSQQEELVKAIVATGKPVVVYLMHGRPLAIPWVVQNVPAIVDGWFMGEEAGNAFANILFGDANPSGKLTITYPKSTGQVPVFYNHKPSARFFDYVAEEKKPLFPFGHGLSYTTYNYSKPRLIMPTTTATKKTGLASMPLTSIPEVYGTVEVDVTNTGSMKGDEIVQLYIRQKISSVTRPVKELKDFARITLEPGQTKTVTFTIDASKLAYWNAEMQYVVEDGIFECMVGRNSTDVQKVELKVGK